ncbi:hypothetical protein HELRODRAFT_91247 [Helobdella robusta]|uniref:Peptidase S54 rhomboid domain-containing protein n=1 Tax=Helobdella robusta TaxID=6412 RepID=T1G818_HELRO|nr:hypothetical protein HELRODRAFT_91247 [Helobdella robusta]ESN89904.1 hypothetical protein HELRODRAFT_91247 [Helobdella robusta]
MEQSRKSLLDRRNLRKVAMANFLAEAEYRKSRLDSSVRRQLDEMEDHRPYFTCWVTFVQVVCYLFAISAYDVAPFGLSFSTITEEVLMPNLALEESSYEEENNMWFGLRQADLIHMGAKYSPCMRSDDVIESYVESDRRRERESGCCVRIDGSGCYQTDEDSCSFPFGREIWKTWKNNAGPYNRSSGPVCQQDPRYCAKPATPLHQHSWPDDIIDWPVCEVPYGSNDLPPHDHDLDHMTCDVTGRPCCVGVKGQCIITTREDCTFKRGYYHDGLTLCSQVNCLEEICGMVPFLYEGRPDQIYRLFFSLFVHAGVVHLLVTVVFQLTIMRDLEKLAGTIRIATIYIVSGLGGCLASVIFLPHLVEAGPSGSQFGLLSCLFVEVIQNRMILKQPCLAILKLSGLMLFLFLLGLMPMIDNFAHLFGFLFGFLLSFVLLPYISISVVDKRNKLMLMIGCFVVCVGLVLILLVVFYLGPIYSCSFCHFINCVPITDTFCRNMKLIKTV